MTNGIASRRASIELDVVSLPGVRALYPLSPLPGAPRIAISQRGGVTRCELRVAADRDVPAADLIRAVTEAVRRAAGDAEVELHIELSTID